MKLITHSDVRLSVYASRAALYSLLYGHLLIKKTGFQLRYQLLSGGSPARRGSKVVEQWRLVTLVELLIPVGADWGIGLNCQPSVSMAAGRGRIRVNDLTAAKADRDI